MPCQHPIKLNKLCALCGQEVQDTENTKFYNALHSNSRLRVDKSTIDGMYVRYRDELIQKKKMILVVDLDQTILHSIEVKGGRVGDNGSRNRNGECGGRGITNKQLLQARPRQPLPSSFTYTLASTTMKTTLRPHLHTFLTELNEMFHMHIYTMGTSEYVHQITNVIDRDRSLFGDRIVTRDDEVLVKRLERLFGDREDMVVVIDDRGDVWEYCGNLVMIRPFFGVDCGGEEGRGEEGRGEEGRGEEGRGEEGSGEEGSGEEGRSEEGSGEEGSGEEGSGEEGSGEEGSGEEGSAQESSSMGSTGRHQLSNKQYGSKGKSTSPSTSTTTPYSNYYANDKELLNLLHTLRSIHQQFYANPNQSAKSIITAQNKKIFKNKTFMVDRCIPDRYNVQSIIRMHGGVVGEDGCDVIVGDEGMVRWVMECVWRRRWIDCVGWMKGLDEWVDEVEKQL